MRNLHISDYDTAVLPGTVSFQLKAWNRGKLDG